MNNPAPKAAWYKQFWPWFIIALPASSVIAGLTTVYIAVKHQDNLVIDDWYKEGRAINQSIARDALAKDLNLEASIFIDRQLGEVIIDLNQDIIGDLTLLLHHTTQQSKDKILPLSQLSTQRYKAQLKSLASGRYHISLSNANTQHNWRLMKESIHIAGNQTSFILTP